MAGTPLVVSGLGVYVPPDEAGPAEETAVAAGADNLPADSTPTASASTSAFATAAPEVAAALADSVAAPASTATTAADNNTTTRRHRRGGLRRHTKMKKLRQELAEIEAETDEVNAAIEKLLAEQKTPGPDLLARLTALRARKEENAINIEKTAEMYAAARKKASERQQQLAPTSPAMSEGSASPNLSDSSDSVIIITGPTLRPPSAPPRAASPTTHGSHGLFIPPTSTPASAGVIKPPEWAQLPPKKSTAIKIVAPSSASSTDMTTGTTPSPRYVDPSPVPVLAPPSALTTVAVTADAPSTVQTSPTPSTPISTDKPAVVSSAPSAPVTSAPSPSTSGSPSDTASKAETAPDAETKADVPATTPTPDQAPDKDEADTSPNSEPLYFCSDRQRVYLPVQDNGPLVEPYQTGGDATSLFQSDFVPIASCLPAGESHLSRPLPPLDVSTMPPLDASTMPPLDVSTMPPTDTCLFGEDKNIAVPRVRLPGAPIASASDVSSPPPMLSKSARRHRDAMGREQSDAVNALGREQSDAVNALGREQSDAANAMGREQSDAATVTEPTLTYYPVSSSFAERVIGSPPPSPAVDVVATAPAVPLSASPPMLASSRPVESAAAIPSLMLSRLRPASPPASRIPRLSSHPLARSRSAALTTPRLEIPGSSLPRPSSPALSRPPTRNATRSPLSISPPIAKFARSLTASPTRLLNAPVSVQPFARTQSRSSSRMSSGDSSRSSSRSSDRPPARRPALRMRTNSITSSPPSRSGSASPIASPVSRLRANSHVSSLAAAGVHRARTDFKPTPPVSKLDANASRLTPGASSTSALPPNPYANYGSRGYDDDYSYGV